MLTHSFKWSFPSILETLGKTVSTSIAISLLLKYEFGYIGIGALLFNYFGFLQLGVADAIVLELPAMFVQKKYSKMKKYTSVAMSFSFLNHILVGVFVFLILKTLNLDFILIKVLVAFSICSSLYQVYLHHIIINRFMYDFEPVSRARYIIAITRGIIQSLATYLYGLNGFLFIECILYISPILFLRHYGNIKLNLYFRKNILSNLLKTGLPLIIISLIGFFASTVDRWFATASGSIEGMASFSALGFLTTLIIFVPTQTLSIFSQYCREFISKKNKAKDLFSSYLSYSTLITLLLTIIGIFILNMVSKIVFYFLPSYNDIIPLLPMVISVVIIKIAHSSISNFCIVTKNPKFVLKTNVIGLVAIVSMNFYLIYVDLLNFYNITLVSLFATIIQLFFILIQININFLKYRDRNIYIFLLSIIFSIISIIGSLFLQNNNPFLYDINIVSYASILFACIAIKYLYRINFFSSLIVIAKKEF